jgi:diguanylate cyclase (GGDEF)-like protein
MKIKTNILLIISAWLFLALTSFLWNYTNEKNARQELAFQTARILFNQIETTRLWNSIHGGVYVPVTEATQPNAYLEKEMKNIKINDTLTLTKVNPALMTRQISEVAMMRTGIQFHITSLNPIRPLNKPTLREMASLNDFEKGIAETGYFINKKTSPAFFYMAPLKTEKECLQCHAVQGYKKGDIRGGISITIPFHTKISALPLILGHAGIWLAGVIGIFFAGNRLSRAYKTIRKQALFDSLTEIPNRRYFSDNIAREFMLSRRNKTQISLIMCDIDNFKLYNDTYGHSKGDKCLKKVAREIQNALKRPGDFCARYGGEEFIVLLPDTSPNGVHHVAERIRSTIEKMNIPHKNSQPEKIVTISLGVTTSDTSFLNADTSYEVLIRHADTALYKAKKQGKNQVA